MARQTRQDNLTEAEKWERRGKTDKHSPRLKNGQSGETAGLKDGHHERH